MDLVDPAIATLHRILHDPDVKDTDALRAAESALDRTGYTKGYEVTYEDARAMLADRLAAARDQDFQ